MSKRYGVDGEAKKKFRDAFYERLATSVSIAAVARATGIHENTIYSWKQEGRGLPDIWEMESIAKAGNQPAAWLAFGAGPTEQEAEVLELFRACSDVDRDLLKVFASRLTQAMTDVMAEKIYAAIARSNEMTRRMESLRQERVAATRVSVAAAPNVSVESPGTRLPYVSLDESLEDVDAPKRLKRVEKKLRRKDGPAKP